MLVLTVIDDRDRADALGADEFRVKPIDREWLLGRLADLSAPDPPTPQASVQATPHTDSSTVTTHRSGR